MWKLKKSQPKAPEPTTAQTLLDTEPKDAAQTTPPKPKKTEPTAFETLGGSALPCPACGAAQVTHRSDYPSNVRPFADKEVLYCTNCGLGFVPGSAAMLADFYRQDYANQNRKDRDIEPDGYFSPEHRAKTKMLQSYFGRATSQIKTLKQHGGRIDPETTRVLDYGSGPGYFLHLSGAKQLFAFEPDEMSQKYLDHLGAKRFDALHQIPAGQFDIIVASHSVEHLVPEELVHTLATLLNALAPGGRLLVEVPAGGHAHLHLDGARQDPHTLFFTPEALYRAAWRAVRMTKTRIIFADALARVEIPKRDNPIYTPSDEKPFFNANRGRLTLVFGKRKNAPA